MNESQQKAFTEWLDSEIATLQTLIDESKGKECGLMLARLSTYLLVRSKVHKFSNDI